MKVILSLPGSLPNRFYERRVTRHQLQSRTVEVIVYFGSIEDFLE